LLAEVDLMKGHFDLAAGQVDRALEINPSDAESYAMRGTALVWAGRAAEALPWLEGALRFDRAAFRAPLNLGLVIIFSTGTARRSKPWIAPSP
jgi:Flp pilus assembly protein TadD